MNKSPDSLDGLLADWAASRQADEDHIRRLTDRILSATREQTVRGGTESDELPHGPIATLPASRRSLFRRSPTARQMMFAGGGIVVLLALFGCLLFYNMSVVSPGNTPSTRPLARVDGGVTPDERYSDSHPAASSLDASELAAKQQLLAETNALFDDQLAWIADGQREMAFEIGNASRFGVGGFMLIRVVVAERTSPFSTWSTVWQADVISRSEALVEVAPKQFDGSSLALWTYQMPNGEVAVDMDLMLNPQLKMHSASTVVLRAGQPARVSCSTKDGVEQCVFQTVMPLTASQI